MALPLFSCTKIIKVESSSKSFLCLFHARIATIRGILLLFLEEPSSDQQREHEICNTRAWPHWMRIWFTNSSLILHKQHPFTKGHPPSQKFINHEDLSNTISQAKKDIVNGAPDAQTPWLKTFKWSQKIRCKRT